MMPMAFYNYPYPQSPLGCGCAAFLFGSSQRPFRSRALHLAAFASRTLPIENCRTKGAQSVSSIRLGLETRRILLPRAFEPLMTY